MFYSHSSACTLDDERGSAQRKNHINTYNSRGAKAAERKKFARPVPTKFIAQESETDEESS